MFDADGSGYISSKELKNVIKALKVDLDDECIDYLMGLMDKDNSGHIDFQEFCSVMLDSFKAFPNLK
jgi:Ca2+-binding EF-hand superfamily protein